MIEYLRKQTYLGLSYSKRLEQFGMFDRKLNDLQRLQDTTNQQPTILIIKKVKHSQEPQ